MVSKLFVTEVHENSLFTSLTPITAIITAALIDSIKACELFVLTVLLSLVFFKARKGSSKDWFNLHFWRLSILFSLGFRTNSSSCLQRYCTLHYCNCGNNNRFTHNHKSSLRSLWHLYRIKRSYQQRIWKEV